jgi:DNA invertase Pin-like site-specific DNA recombinase
MRKPATDPSKAVAYLRCSTERQDLSPDAQRDAIAAWAAANGVEVVAWHEDLGVSGGTELEKRPGLLAATESLRTEGAGVLVVAKRDRLARDVLTAALVERLAERAGARVVAADGTGNGDGPEAALLRTMIDAFAAYERALIRGRTKAALAVKKAKGERVGTVPYGFRSEDGTLVPDAQEQEALRLARRLRAEGESLRGIGRALLDAGYEPRAATQWHVAVLSRLVG